MERIECVSRYYYFVLSWSLDFLSKKMKTLFDDSSWSVQSLVISLCLTSPQENMIFGKRKMRIAKVASYPSNTWLRIHHCSRLSQYLWRQGLESLTASLSSSHISLVREKLALALPVLLCSCASRRALCALCLAIAGRGSEGDKRLFAQTVELHGAELCRFKSSYQFHVTLLLLQVTRRIAQGLSAFT